MNKLISLIMLTALVSNVAMADCDFSKIVINPDGSRTYSKELHICVGQMKQDLDIANSQLADYKKAIDLKDLALVDTQKRSDIWMNTSFQLQDRMNAVDKLKSSNELLYFIGGVIFTGLSVWGAGQLVHH